jgi:hypothetical protein
MPDSIAQDILAVKTQKKVENVGVLKCTYVCDECS